MKDQKKPGVGQFQLLLTVAETGRLLRLSTSKVYTLLGDRYPDGIPVKRFGRSVRISLSDLRRWVEHYPITDKLVEKARKDGLQG